MRIDILTVFPAMFRGPLTESMLARAAAKKIVGFNIVDLRDFARDRHRKTDDCPYGGGAGMVMKPEPFFEAFGSLGPVEGARVIMPSPAGRPFDQAMAAELAGLDLAKPAGLDLAEPAGNGRLILLCGHYEGIDGRVAEGLGAEEISVGDYILTGGEIAALAIVDAVVRLLPGVLGDDQSAVFESFADGRLEAPQYTRPAEYRGMKVPEVLLSGDHQAVECWRRERSEELTARRRPDLLEKLKKINQAIRQEE